MTTENYNLRRRIKVLWGVIVALIIFNICLLVRMNHVYDTKIIYLSRDEGYNTLRVQHTDTTELFNVPDSMVDRLVSHIDQVVKSDTTRD